MEMLLTTLRALGDETRLRIAAVLLAGPFNVNELVGILGLGQSRVSRHLKILLDAGLVRARRDGSWVYYTLADAWRDGRAVSDRAGVGGDGVEGDGVAPLLTALAGSLQGALEVERDAVNRCLERRREQAGRFFGGPEVAAGWDARRDSVQGPADYLDRVVEALGPAETVVDLGTGTGVLLSRLSGQSSRVIGVDASDEMLRVARDHVRELGLGNVELRLGALEHLPLADGEADAAVANMVLHHVAQPGEALREARRSLRPGGRLAIADFRTHTQESYREKLGDLWLGFEQHEVAAWLDGAGFDVERLEEVSPAGGRPAVFLALASLPGETDGETGNREARSRARIDRKERSRP